MSSMKLIVIGGSAGAIPSILEIVRVLPAGLPAAILVVIHQSPSYESVMPRLITNAGEWPGKHPESGDDIERGYVYVAPPDMHLLVRGATLQLSRGAKENHHRPSIDVTFRSAAVAFGPRAIGVLLSGYLDDGTAGVLAIKQNGGVVIVQDPSDTLYPDMPRNAIENVRVNNVMPVGAIPSALADLSRRPPRAGGSSETRTQQMENEIDMADFANGAKTIAQMPGKASAYVCPECKGTLWEIEEDEVLRYRCHEGHAFSPMSLVAGQNEALEAALWSALRALDEKVTLARHLETRAQQRGQSLAANRFNDQALRSAKHAAAIRGLLKEGEGGPKLQRIDEGNVQPFAAEGSHDIVAGPE